MNEVKRYFNVGKLREGRDYEIRGRSKFLVDGRKKKREGC